MTNWPAYNESLRQRGDLTIWVKDEALSLWTARRRTSRSGQPKYSDLAITLCLTLRVVYGLALRQTKGLMRSVVALMGFDIAVPDFSTMTRRSKGLALPSTKPRATTSGPVHLVVDSTGLKVFGEGVRGSLAKQLIARYKLDEGRDVPKFGIGLKELWEVKPENHKPGLVQHSFGWPLGMKTGGGSFLYHLEDNLVAVGFVVHLNYKNPYLFPFEEFQRFKTHPAIRGTFEGGKRLSYGARAITEGGYQSVPKLSFPGGALIGCSAGFVNVPRIKGSHNAVLSGILAAEKLAAAIAEGRANDEPIEIERGWRESAIGQDLKRVRNVKPLWSRFGTAVGVALGGHDMWTNQLFGFSFFGTLKHGKTDAQSLEPASKHQKIDYPKPDGVLTFDRLSSVFLSNTNHEEDQPVHLQVKDWDLQKRSEYEVYAGPSSRYCPAGVYEWVEKDGQPTFVINAQNCVHCKTCDIKDWNQNINWVPPQGAKGRFTGRQECFPNRVISQPAVDPA